MAEYIEKEKAARILREEAAAHYPTPYHVGLLAAARAIESFPAADVRPVVRGKWKYRGQKVIDDLFPTYACSVCHGVIPADWRRKCNFCPNCGADMRPASMSVANGEES